MKPIRILLAAFISFFCCYFPHEANAQIYAPEGLNIPGNWNGWANPPAPGPLASATQVTGGEVTLITTGTRRYHTVIACPADVPAGNHDFLFTSGPSGSAWNNTWKDVNVTFNTLQTYTYNGSSNNNITVTSGKWYVVNWEDLGYVNTRAIIMELSEEPATINSVTQSPAAANVYLGQAVDVTVTLSDPPALEEKVYVRYSTDNFVTSSLVQVSFIGNVGTATIPAQTSPVTVSYYVFSTTINNPTADYDMYTINFNNNGGSNYTYTVKNAYTTINAGDWNTGSTWATGSVPPANANVEINHAVTVNGTVANPAATVSISSGASLTFGASGKLSMQSLIIQGNLIASQGEITFTGGGSVTGAASFNNVVLTGGHDFGGNATINGTLKINPGGYISANPPIYAAGSTLQYNTNTLYGRGLEWSATSGPGYPDNVLITNNTQLNLGANGGTSTAFQINGTLTIDPGAALYMDYGSDDMTQPLTINGDLVLNGTLSLSDALGGDLILKGDFTYNAVATFNPKGRLVHFTGTTPAILGGSNTYIGFDYLTISNTGGLTLQMDIGVDEELKIDGGGILNAGAANINMSSANFNVVSGTFNRNTGRVVFSGTCSVLGTVDFNNVRIGSSFPGGVTMGPDVTIHGTLEIALNGFISAGNAPKYADGSKLRYSTSVTFTASNGEWYENTYGYDPGVPYDVEIANNTTASFGTVGFPREMRGSLTITPGSTFELSTAAGGDLFIKGNIYNNGTFNAKGREVKFNGTTNQEIHGTITFDYMRIENSAGVTVNSAADVTVTKRISITSGTLNTNNNLTLEDGAALMHGAGTPDGGGNVSGNVKIKRAGSSNSIVFNLWGSPVQNAPVSTLGSNVFYYDETLNNADYRDDWVPASGTLVVGKGYAASGAGTVTFNGVVNDGNFNIPITSTGSGAEDGWNLIANPYPSAVDADQFISANSGKLVGGALYFWDDPGTGQNNFTTADYATYNILGGVAGGGGNTPNGFIGSGQSFFIKSASPSTTVSFNNTMRSDNNSQFFRQGNALERIRLTLTSANNDFNEILIAVKDDATDGYDQMYDALKMTGNPNIAFYSLIGSDKYAIQGIAPVTSYKTVPLGYDCAADGYYTIKAAAIENFDETVIIWLEDTETGIRQNLRSNDTYNFYSTAGTHTGRFLLHINAPLHLQSVDASCSGNDGKIMLDQPGITTWDFTLLSSRNTIVRLQPGFNGVTSIEQLKPGTYTLLLYHDGYQVSREIEVSGPQPVVAGFDISEELPAPGELIRFENLSGGATGWIWDFGDGRVVSGIENPVHSYSLPGKYTVTLTAFNNDCRNVTQKIIPVMDKTTGIETPITETPYQIIIHDNLLEVNFANHRTPEYIQLLNVLGQRFIRVEACSPGNEIDLTGIQPGIYLVEFTLDGRNIVEKLYLGR